MGISAARKSQCSCFHCTQFFFSHIRLIFSSLRLTVFIRLFRLLCYESIFVMLHNFSLTHFSSSKSKIYSLAFFSLCLHFFSSSIPNITSSFKLKSTGHLTSYVKFGDMLMQNQAFPYFLMTLL